MGKPKPQERLNLLFCLLEGIFWTMNGITQGFFVTYLQGFGYSDSFIGLVMMTVGISCLLFQPVWGFFSDRFGRVRLIFLALLTTMGGGVLMLFALGTNPAVALVYGVLSGATLQSLIGILDSWIAKLSKVHPTLDFGKARGAGSLFYSFAAIGLGSLMGYFGNPVARWLYLGLYLCALPIVLLLPDPAVPQEKAQTAAGTERVSTREAVRVLLGNRKYIVFIFCTFLTMLTLQSVFSFYPVLLSSMGGGSRELGWGYFVMAFTEYWVMTQFTPLIRRFGINRVYAFGMVGHFVKSVLFCFSPTVTLAVLACVSQGFSFALTIPGQVEYISKNIDKRYIATAQLLALSLSMSMAQILGSPIFGYLSQNFGVKTMLLLASFPALAGGLLFMVTQCRGKENGSQGEA